ncbi:hypothetical protein B9G55_16860 [Saccharibacillus sp. O16]|nr:hypothetical protein B9G55_16860 [Saccharibacillus sp. O16]
MAVTPFCGVEAAERQVKVKSRLFPFITRIRSSWHAEFDKNRNFYREYPGDQILMKKTTSS